MRNVYAKDGFRRAKVGEAKANRPAGRVRGDSMKSLSSCLGCSYTGLLRPFFLLP